jgi:hypothetical protein
MFLLALGVVIGLQWANAPVERDMAILILTVALGVDVLNRRLTTLLGRKADA